MTELIPTLSARPSDAATNRCEYHGASPFVIPIGHALLNRHQWARHGRQMFEKPVKSPRKRHRAPRTDCVRNST